LRLVEQTVAKDDPDPKALACYGLLVRWWTDGPAAPPHEEAWLRFVDGRPVSASTHHHPLPRLGLHETGRRRQDRAVAGVGQCLLAPEQGSA